MKQCLGLKQAVLILVMETWGTTVYISIQFTLHT